MPAPARALQAGNGGQTNWLSDLLTRASQPRAPATAAAATAGW